MAKTIIGASIMIEGDVSGDDSLVVLGTVKGKVNVKQQVCVDRGGTVQADIETESLQVSGQVQGSVHAKERAEITPEGRMVGDIRAPRILIAEGAHFKGSIDMG